MKKERPIEFLCATSVFFWVPNILAAYREKYVFSTSSLDDFAFRTSKEIRNEFWLAESEHHVDTFLVPWSFFGHPLQKKSGHPHIELLPPHGF